MGIFDKFRNGFKKSASAFTTGLKEIIQKDKSGEIFDKTPKNLSKAILKGLEKKRNENYKSNIKKSKGKYSWLSFIKKIQSV